LLNANISRGRPSDADTCVRIEALEGAGSASHRRPAKAGEPTIRGARESGAQNWLPQTQDSILQRIPACSLGDSECHPVGLSPETRDRRPHFGSLESGLPSQYPAEGARAQTATALSSSPARSVSRAPSAGRGGHRRAAPPP
jgi:hypothetical protein